jgi:uncharacterized protein YcbX
MDITKFRPNIVVSGTQTPFVEDFWAELTFSAATRSPTTTKEEISSHQKASPIKMPLTANCYRCQSITVDYSTGKAHTDDRGQVWKKLNKDRRVDKGAKYSPVFGRYGFCGGNDVGHEIHVGDHVRVSKRNASRTVFGKWRMQCNVNKSI